MSFASNLLDVLFLDGACQCLHLLEVRAHLLVQVVGGVTSECQEVHQVHQFYLLVVEVEVLEGVPDFSVSSRQWR